MNFDRRTMIGIARRFSETNAQIARLSTDYDAEIDRLRRERDRLIEPKQKRVARLERGLKYWHRIQREHHNGPLTDDLVHVTLTSRDNTTAKVETVEGETAADAGQRLFDFHPTLVRTKTERLLDRKAVKAALLEGTYGVDEDGRVVTADGELIGLRIVPTGTTYNVKGKRLD